MSSNHFVLCRPPPPSIFPSIRVFWNESVLLIRWPKYWNFSFSISPSSEYSGLISFRMDWLDLLAIQGTLLKDLLQHDSPKASILQCSSFFIVQLLHPYMVTGKTIALTSNTQGLIWSSVHLTFSFKIIHYSFWSLIRHVINIFKHCDSIRSSVYNIYHVCLTHTQSWLLNSVAWTVQIQFNKIGILLKFNKYVL